MKKVLALVLSLALCMMTVSVLAEIVICQNKVEITAAMQDYAKLYKEKTGVDVKVITGGGSSDYNTVLKAEMASGREPDIWVIEGPTSYELWKDKIADMTGENAKSNTPIIVGHCSAYDDAVLVRDILRRKYSLHDVQIQP